MDNRIFPEDASEAVRIEVLNARMQGAFNGWLGLAIKDVHEDGLTLDAAWRPEFVGRVQGGFVHGGVLASIIDTTGANTVMMRIGLSVATLDLHVDYHRPSAGPVLRARTRVLRLGRSMAVVATEITDAADRLLASGRGAYQWAQAAAAINTGVTEA